MFSCLPHLALSEFCPLFSEAIDNIGEYTRACEIVFYFSRKLIPFIPSLQVAVEGMGDLFGSRIACGSQLECRLESSL